ncbi:YceI family protein [Hymenobacter jeollabukensis]|uniref:YceI family protein n=1 Tax=Hymenobacter jeollabukensis TaxID=2025313 RepID=A0A5R8WMD9_9BACT|nr:YceI family protein [Hymenobacter jeollabukensis]TLM90059.1 YceI family protein [Hymenobacter jeollabukensis]
MNLTLLTRRLAALSLALLTTLLLAARPAGTAYQVQPAASRLTWTGHADLGTYAPSGTLQLRAGTLRYDGRRLRAARATVDMRSLHHDNAQLQEHLRGADFFDVERFPTAGFRLQSTAGGQARGLLTIKGLTQSVTFPFTLTRGAAGELRLRGTASLDRTRFGIRYNSRSFFANVGDQAIRNDFQLTFDIVAGPEPAADASGATP